jgi:hypothetical protein
MIQPGCIPLLQYLAEVECPIPYNERQQQEVLLWLLRYAAHLEFVDRQASGE